MSENKIKNKLPKEVKENWEKEEWGGWKIVSEMLDNPDKNGIYPTSKCYKKLYDFVVAQKRKAKMKERDKVGQKMYDTATKQAKRKMKEEFKKVVEKVKAVNESNGRYNACNEILKSIEEL